MKKPGLPLVHISLFSGIGGFEIAADEVGWINAASCEINDFGHKVLSYHFPHAYHHRDVKTLTYQNLNDELTKRFGPGWRSNGVILTGGFPCQGFSVAGQRLGTDDDRYLWPEYLRLIDEINPDWVCGENVTGILSMEDKSGIYRDVFAKVENRKITRLYPVDYYEAIYTRQAKMLVGSICESLEARGYEVQTFAIPACSVEAPHKRERIWFVANRGRIAGDRRESEQSGNGIDHGENSGREETADQFERSYQTWDDTENQSEWRNLAYLFESPGESFIADSANTGAEAMRREGENEIHEPWPARHSGCERQERAEQPTTRIDELCESRPVTHPIGDDAGRYGHGETGPSPRHCKVIQEERERLRAIAERTGGEEFAADSDSKFFTASESQEWGNEERTRGQFEGCDKNNVTNTGCNGSGKSLEWEQSEQFDEDDKAKGTDPNPSIPGRQELNPPGFAAKPGFGGGICNGGIGRGRFDNFPTQSPVCSRNDGFSDQLDGITFSKWRNESIKGFGNAVVPQVVFEIFSAIKKYRIFEA